MAFTLGIILALAAMFAWGINKIFSKKALEKLDSYSVTLMSEMFYLLTIAAAVLASAIMFGGLRAPSVPDLIQIIVIAGIGALGIFFFNKGLKEGLVSIVAPVAASYMVFAVIFSHFIWNENLTILQYAAAGIIFIGVALVSIDFSKLQGKNANKLKKGIKYALATALMWGIFFTLIKLPIRKLGSINATLFLAIFSTLWLTVPLLSGKTKFSIKSLRKADKKIWFFIILAGSIMAIGDITNNLAMSAENVSLVVPITASSTLVSVVLAAIFLKEKLKINETIGIILAVIGILMISV